MRPQKIIIQILIFLTLQISVIAKQYQKNTISYNNSINIENLTVNQSTIFPQIHTNLNGMVREFVRKIYQDTKGNYWFGTNGDGIIRYDGKTLEKITIEEVSPRIRVINIIEDNNGNIWFGTSDGLLKYDGQLYTKFSNGKGLSANEQEIWGLTIDKNGLIWLGSFGGVFQFDGEKFTPFTLPDIKVENANSMLSDKLVFKIIEDKKGNIWFVTDGNGIFKYNKGEFIHLTKSNGLTDNSVSDIFEDSKGNIWIGTFYGGASKFDGKTFTNFTKDGIIDGIETFNFFEDSKRNIWFTAEGYGVYRYDGSEFTQFTTKDGLTSDVVQSIFEDGKGQIWFGTWQGLCIFDGEKFVNANEKEPWTN